jgi:hypothetical protein
MTFMTIHQEWKRHVVMQSSCERQAASDEPDSGDTPSGSPLVARGSPPSARRLAATAPL